MKAIRRFHRFSQIQDKNNLRNLWIFPLVTFVVALGVYAATLAPDLTWANFGTDGGDLITAAVTLGVPHPSGYPTYVLLGKAFSWLPIGTVAYRFNLFSAVCTAVAAAFLTATVCRMPYSVFRNPTTAHGSRLTDYGSRLTDYRLPALAAGLTFAFAPLVWSQAVIAEVYGLQLALLSIFLWSLLGKRPFWQTGLWLGLSVTGHLTSLLFVPLALLLTPRRGWGRLAGGTAVGLLPIFVPALLARSGSPVIWEDPTTLRGWWRLVSGALYRANLLAVPAHELLARSGAWALTLLNQFTLLGLPLVVFGGWRAWRHGHKRWVLGLGATAVAVIGYALTYGTTDAIIFMLPALLLLSVLLAAGLYGLGWPVLLLPLALLLINFNAQNMDTTAVMRGRATHLLQMMPPRAVVLTPGDPTIFSLWYFQHVESVRPDLILVDSNLFAFDWYRDRLQADYPQLDGLAVDDLDTFEQRNVTQRPFCRVTLTTPITDATDICEGT